MAYSVRPSVWLLGLCCGVSVLVAQPAGLLDSSATAPQPAVPGVDPETGTLSNKKAPALPGSKTPAETFRELLAMDPAERTRSLADRTEHQRKYLESRLKEYEALSPEQRDARLRQLELTYHLDILLRAPLELRAERLSRVPVELRPIVDDRLRQWDLLPPRVKQDVLEHDTTANYFLRVRAIDAAPGLQLPVKTKPPAVLDKPRKRGTQFSHFFALPRKEQEKTLEALPASERHAMEKTLERFATLTPEQQSICIDSFERFTRMSSAQRVQFLKNAARWKAMAPRERETWRALVEILPPTPEADAISRPVGTEAGSAPHASNAPIRPAEPTP